MNGSDNILDVVSVLPFFGPSRMNNDHYLAIVRSASAKRNPFSCWSFTVSAYVISDPVDDPPLPGLLVSKESNAFFASGGSSFMTADGFSQLDDLVHMSKSCSIPIPATTYSQRLFCHYNIQSNLNLMNMDAAVARTYQAI